MEAKRHYTTKHYDYILLRVIGWIMLVATLFAKVNPIHHAEPTYTLSQFVWSVYLIVSSGNRKTMYINHKIAKVKVNENK